MKKIVFTTISFCLLLSQTIFAQSYSSPESVEFDYVNNRYLIANRAASQILARAADVVRELAELLQIPVVTTLMARGAFPDNHPLCLGMPGMHGNATAITAMQKSDLLINFGARFDDRVTGKVSTFAPDPNGPILELSVVANNLLVGGQFTTIQGLNSNINAASFSNANVLGQTALLPTLAPNPNGSVNFIGSVNNLILMGGEFTEIEFAKRNRVAAINTQTGLPTTFNSNINNGTVLAIEASGNNVFIGGNFYATSGGYPCNNFITFFNTGNVNKIFGKVS
jgi:hypothetical protein